MIYNNPQFDTYLNDKISEYVMWNYHQEWQKKMISVNKELIKRNKIYPRYMTVMDGRTLVFDKKRIYYDSDKDY
jgi:hypothetical protein